MSEVWRCSQSAPSRTDLASLMTYFRKRLGSDGIQEVNEWIAIEEAKKQASDQGSGDNDSSGGSDARSANGSLPNLTTEPPLYQGKLLLDATCSPADMAYPTDLSLFNDARE